MIVWVTKTRAEAIAAGRNPNTIQENTFTPDKIIEVKQTGPTSGDVVWEWHVWDHLIQDYDSSKDNYGVVGDHPELIDINFGEDFVGDWLHTNSLDYNSTFDQILIDVHNFNEVWVIDHSTTTEEAADHTGGHYGHGGDLLYRWGNPQAYDRGTSSDQILYGQHDASWIKPGYPGAGDVLVFNNGYNRPGGDYSTVDEFTPPIDVEGNYYLEPGSAYGPENLTWSYTANPPGSLYSQVFGGALRLKDGNTLICDGIPGEFFEVTPDESVVWQWTNSHPNPTWNAVFKIDYIPPEEPPQPPINNTPDLDCTGSLSWSDIKPGATVHGSFQVQNVGDPGSLLNWTVNNSLTWGTWTFSPASGEDLTPEEGPVTVQVYVVAPNEKNKEFNGTLRVQNKGNASDFDTIPVTLKTSASTVLTTANPFIHMVRQWLSFMTGLLGRMNMGHFPSYDIMQQMFHTPR
jgi:signal peptidase I